jgi:hypothetical protein
MRNAGFILALLLALALGVATSITVQGEPREFAAATGGNTPGPYNPNQPNGMDRSQ